MKLRVMVRARSFAAAVLLPCVTFAFAAPLPVHRLPGAPDCHHSGSAGAVLAPAPASGSACEHSTSSTCAAMLGCATAATPLLSAASRLTVLLAFAAPLAFGDGALHGRLGLGPPTPPPNS